MSEDTATINPNLTVNEGKVWASSLDVAESFEKRHDNVLRDIDQLKKDAPDFCLLNFEETVKTRQNPAKNIEGELESRAVLMTRDGFTLLAMGFTGKKALRFKLAYIEAFNRMEAELRGRAAQAARLAGIPPLETLAVARQPGGRPGPDWFTMQEIASAWDMPRRSAALRVADLTRRGEVEVRRASNPWQPHYYRFAAEGGEWPEEAAFPGREPDWDGLRSKNGARFLGYVNAKGRITLEEITGDDMLLRKKDLPRLLADPAFRLSADANEQRMVLMEIAAVATMRANYNANVARSLVYGNDFEKRQAAAWMAAARQATA